MMNQNNLLAGFKVGCRSPLFLIAGPCVIESEDLILEIAGTLKEMTQALKINFIFKASFDKANRSSLKGFRGLGLEKGLAILQKVRDQLQLPVLTDVHEGTPLQEVAAVVDVLQTPAFLCRQTDFITRVAQQGLPVNLKKGQFLAPLDMKNVIEKARSAALYPDQTFMVCERGVSFGYHNLVVDYRSLALLRQTHAPVVFDVTHSVQLPGGLGHASSGQREFIPLLARAAAAAGIDGLFMETHPDPDRALSDGPNNWPLHQMRPLLEQIVQLDAQVKSWPWLEEGLEATP